VLVLALCLIIIVNIITYTDGERERVAPTGDGMRGDDVRRRGDEAET